ncbi:MAG: hypothetical protein MZV70_28750 [Desulfobacterales bacterium]|nr:hypothetical protein [Desulfobacterales bacterium]
MARIAAEAGLITGAVRPASGDPDPAPSKERLRAPRDRSGRATARSSSCT